MNANDAILKRRFSEEMKVPLMGLGDRYVVDEKQRLIKNKASALVNAPKMPEARKKECEEILRNLLEKKDDFVFTPVRYL